MQDTAMYSQTPMKLYDKTLEVNLTMYDNMPYKRDDSICNRSTVRLISGNIIKYYRCKFALPFVLDNDERL